MQAIRLKSGDVFRGRLWPVDPFAAAGVSL